MITIAHRGTHHVENRRDPARKPATRPGRAKTGYSAPKDATCAGNFRVTLTRPERRTYAQPARRRIPERGASPRGRATVTPARGKPDPDRRERPRAGRDGGVRELLRPRVRARRPAPAGLPLPLIGGRTLP